MSTCAPRRRFARQRQRKIHPVQQCAGIHPGVGLVRIARRRLALIERLADARRSIAPASAGSTFGAHRARGRGHQLERRLDLGAIRVLRPELRRIDHGVQHFADVAVGAFRYVCAMRSTSASGGLSETKCCASSSEMWCAVCGSRARRSSTSSPSFIPPASILWPSTVFGSVSCMRSSKKNSRIALRLPDRPAGEGARDFDHVLLRVSAIHAERVQLHQLAAVIFVQAALLFLALLRHWLAGGIAERRGTGPPNRRAIAPGAALLLLLQLRPGAADRRSASYPGRRASPGFSRWPRAGRGICPWRAGEWRRVRRR